MLNSSSKEFVEFNHARIQYTDYPHIDYFEDSVQLFDGEYYFDGVVFYYRDGKREHGNVQIDNIDYNFLSQELPFGPLPCHTWGTIFIILFVALSAVAFCMYREDTTRLPLLAALLVSGTVCFATKMMPRYLYPAVVLLIFAYVIRPTVKRFLCAVNFTICFFLLTFSDYVIYPQWEYTAELIWPRIVSVYFIFCVGMLTYVTFIEPLDAAADRSCTCS